MGRVAGAWCFAVVMFTSTAALVASASMSSSPTAVTSEDCTALREDVRTLKAQVHALMRRRAEDLRVLEKSLRTSLEEELRDDSVRRVASAASRNEAAALRWAASAVRELRAQAAATAAARNASARAADAREREAAAALRLLRSDVDALRDETQRLRAHQEEQAAEAHALRADVGQAQQRAEKAAELSASNAEKLLSAQDEWSTEAKSFRAALTLLKTPEASSAPTDRTVSGANPSRARRHGGVARGRLAARVSALEASVQAHASEAATTRQGALRLLEGQQALQARLDEALPALQAAAAGAQAQEARLGAQARRLQEEQMNEEKTAQALAGGQAALKDRLNALQEKLKDIAAGAAGQMAANEEDNSLQPMADSGSANRGDGALPALQNQLRQMQVVQEQYKHFVHQLPPDCGTVARSGLHVLAPGGGPPLVAPCEAAGRDEDSAESKSHGGQGRGDNDGTWTVVQRRISGEEDFNRSWAQYALGFGSPAGEFWLGNGPLHRLTQGGCSSLRVELEDIYGVAWVALYNHFLVDSEKDGFRLHVSGYSGNASDALAYQDGMQFSAVDSDRDSSNTHCAANYEGGWWFSHCQHANLNGRYALGLTWFDGARNEWIAVARSRMLVRQRHHCPE